MRFVDKYQDQFASIESPSIRQVIEGVDVYEFPEEMKFVKSSRSTIVVGENIEPRDAVRWYKSRGVGFFINKNRDEYFNSMFAACLLIKNPDQFAKKPLPFFIRDFDIKKSAKGVRYKEIRFHSTKSREKDLNTIAEFFAENKKTKNRIQMAHLIADEMMTNAIFNAPVDFNGVHLYHQTNRTDEVTLPPHEGANLFIAHDEERLFISCRDPFGSLGSSDFIDRLYNTYWEEDGTSPREGGGGAGLGCKMMIDNSSDFFVISSKDRYTLFGCAIPLGKSRRALSEYPKNMYFLFK